MLCAANIAVEQEVIAVASMIALLRLTRISSTLAHVQSIEAVQRLCS